MRAIAPKGSLEVVEEAWNCYPHCKTVISNPAYMKGKFHITIETIHKEDDTGKADNIHNLPPELLAKCEVIVIDIVNDRVERRVCLVSRGQTTIFAQGVIAFGALILKAITPLRENSGLATRDYGMLYCVCIIWMYVYVCLCIVWVHCVCTERMWVCVCPCVCICVCMCVCMDKH